MPFLVLRYEDRRAREGRTIEKASSRGPRGAPRLIFSVKPKLDTGQKCSLPFLESPMPQRGPKRAQCERCRTEVGVRASAQALVSVMHRKLLWDQGGSEGLE